MFFLVQVPLPSPFSLSLNLRSFSIVRTVIMQQCMLSCFLCMSALEINGLSYPHKSNMNRTWYLERLSSKSDWWYIFLEQKSLIPILLLSFFFLNFKILSVLISSSDLNNSFNLRKMEGMRRRVFCQIKLKLKYFSPLLSVFLTPKKPNHPPFLHERPFFFSWYPYSSFFHLSDYFWKNLSYLYPKTQVKNFENIKKYF